MADVNEIIYKYTSEDYEWGATDCATVAAELAPSVEKAELLLENKRLVRYRKMKEPVARAKAKKEFGSVGGLYRKVMKEAGLVGVNEFQKGSILILSGLVTTLIGSWDGDAEGEIIGYRAGDYSIFVWTAVGLARVSEHKGGVEGWQWSL